YPVEQQVQPVIRDAVAALRLAGATVVEVQMHWTRAVTDEWFDLWCVFMSAFFGAPIERYRKDMDPAVVAMIARGLVM
ncbi:amidase, partial [Rhizobium ruizarguesonis]